MSMSSSDLNLNSGTNPSWQLPEGSTLPSYARYDVSTGKVHVNIEQAYTAYLKELGDKPVNAYWIAIAQWCLIADLHHTCGNGVIIRLETDMRYAFHNLGDDPVGGGDGEGTSNAPLIYSQLIQKRNPVAS